MPRRRAFIKALKQEEIDGRAYRDAAEARSLIGTFIEQIYNRQRLHSALAYRPPAEFEANLPSFGAAAQGPQTALIASLSDSPIIWRI